MYEENSKVQQGYSKNHYGQGLHEFLIGYLYEKFSETLVLPETRKYFNDKSKSNSCQYLIENKDQGFEIALKYYEKAYSHFKKVNHLLGVYLSMKRTAITYDSYAASSM